MFSFFSKEDIEAGAVDRPTLWAIADIETGEIIEKRDCKQIVFSDASYDVKYNVHTNGQCGVSKEYYNEAFTTLDSVRSKLISTGELDIAEYRYYLDKIVAPVPKVYQRFYRELSI